MEVLSKRRLCWGECSRFMSLCCFGKWVWVCHTIQSSLLSPWPTFQPMNGLPSGIVNFLKHMDFQSSHGVSFQRQGCWEKPFSIHTKLKVYHLCCKFGMCFTKMIMYPRFFIPCKKKVGHYKFTTLQSLSLTKWIFIHNSTIHDNSSFIEMLGYKYPKVDEVKVIWHDNIHELIHKKCQ